MAHESDLGQHSSDKRYRSSHIKAVHVSVPFSHPHTSEIPC